ncbi:MAG: hypothetical protein HY912_19085 [Desulfomonile tiedjei]|uniref:Cadherin repeat domain-containing protein n=1 Tax=Desulfomonile tiedjei TaxID=2358 RepID=A0A9D6V3V3_9BACT|nr:hypothetical protein [Desulfomonile tiedjei]
MKYVGRLFTAVSVVIGALLGCSLAAAAGEGVPRVKEVKFYPDRPATGDALKLRIGLDGSALRAEVKISKNNDELETTYYDGFSEFLEIKNRFKAGDKVKAEVIPIDAAGSSGEPSIKSVEIANAPPTAKLVDQKITGNTYNARIEAKDPEGDTIVFSLKQGPSGLVIDQKGNLSWQIGETTAGTFPIAISVKDSHGAEVVLSYSVGLRREQGR